jgi:hypothetical protein
MTALRYTAYVLTPLPIRSQRAFPGNIGRGTSKEATVIIAKNTIRIGIPLITFHLRGKAL